MSRVGKKPILIPDKIKVTLKNREVTVKGEKGTISRSLPPAVGMKVEDGIVNVTVDSEDRKSFAFQGLARSLIANMVKGVSKGFERRLEINGIGYRAELKGKNIIFNIGYSNPVDFELPDGISAKVDKTSITLFGIDNELLGRTAASIRQLRPPEPYKGKGIKYAEERIQRKAGKTGAA
ncbi:MAG: 50S ribosomal protein L6 [Desulfobacterales bacterium]|nr:50S ribosomal protein L6 [Desulfobacterales bacterium]